MKNKAYCHCLSLGCLDLDALRDQGIRWLLLDLDNTLDSPYSKSPSRSVFDFGKSCRNAGIKVAIISNNMHFERAYSYAQAVGATFFLCRALKPFKRRVARVMREQGVYSDETLFCGDQLLTDRKVAKKLGIRFCLVNPVDQSELMCSRFNRALEKPLRKRWLKRGLLGTFYGDPTNSLK